MARREDRYPLALGANCRTMHSRKNVSLWDLSSHGCRVLLSGMDLRVGQMIVLKTEGLEALSGTVRWCGNEFAGVEFDHPLHPSVVGHLCQMNPDESRIELAFAA